MTYLHCNCLSHSQPRMYTDDVHLTCAGVDMNAILDCLNINLEDIRKWLIANKLTLNIAKVEFMLIGSRQRLGTFTSSPALVINRTLINQVSTSKYLGVTIDENLTWDDHIDKVAKKIASSIAALKRVRQFVPRQPFFVFTML